MNLFKKQPCNACKKEKMFVKERVYKVPKMGVNIYITSNGKLCGKCYKGIKKITQSQ